MCFLVADVISATLTFAYSKNFSGNDEVSFVFDETPVCDGKRAVHHRIGDGTPDIYDLHTLGG